MKTREEKILNQIHLQEKVVSDAAVNLVTCGQCGSLMLHEVRPLELDQELECPFCDFESDPCDFPDYFYEGFELSAVHKPTIEEWLKEKLGKLREKFPEVKYRVENKTYANTWLVEVTPIKIFESLEYTLEEDSIENEFDKVFGDETEIIYISTNSLNKVENVTFEI